MDFMTGEIVVNLGCCFPFHLLASCSTSGMGGDGVIRGRDAEIVILACYKFHLHNNLV